MIHNILPVCFVAVLSCIYLQWNQFSVALDWFIKSNLICGMIQFSHLHSCLSFVAINITKPQVSWTCCVVIHAWTKVTELYHYHFLLPLTVALIWVICDVSFWWWWLKITILWDATPCILAENLLMFWRKFWLPSLG